MEVKYRLTNVGRSKWCGEVVAKSEHADDVEFAIYKEATKHLASKGVDIEGDTERGIILAGFRTVGTYEKVYEVTR